MHIAYKMITMSIIKKTVTQGKQFGVEELAPKAGKKTYAFKILLRPCEKKRLSMIMVECYDF